MGTLRRPDLPSDVLRAIGLVCLADAVVGLAFGAITTGAGLPVWLPVVLSVAVFGGAAQFLFVGVVAAGGSPLAAAAAALLVNTRLLPLGLAVGDLLGPGRLRTLAGTHLVTDETVAFATAQREVRHRRAAFWVGGTALVLAWNAGVLAGTVGGRLVPDTDALGLDAAFPAVLLALVLPALRDRATLRAALVGAVIAVAASPWLPAGLPVLLALAGVLVALPRREQPRGEQPPGEQPPGEQPPGEQPPGEQPPGEQPPGEQPPGEQPPGEQPPGEQPPGEQR